MMSRPVSRLYTFLHKLTPLLKQSTFIASHFSHVKIILNPNAGGFRKGSLFKKHLSVIENYLGNVKEEELDLSSPLVFSEKFACSYYQTEYPGHAREIAREITARKVKGKTLILSVGGDGTSHEVATGILYNKIKTGSVSLFRLPMGTGNDNADSRNLASALRALDSGCESFEAAALRVSFADGTREYSMNIASFGLDAYVAYLTNVLKEKIPGDFYKLMVDVSSVFYQQLMRIKPMKLFLRDHDFCMEGRFLLLAVGVSGERSYGAGKKVLPGKNNICAIDRLNLVQIAKLKNLFYKGEHTSLPMVHMESSRKIEIHYGGRLPFQADGEIRWLDKADFPVKIELLPGVLTVLKA